MSARTLAIPPPHDPGGEATHCYFCGRPLDDRDLLLWIRVVHAGRASVHLDDIEQFYSEVAWDYAGDRGWFAVDRGCADSYCLLPGFAGHRDGPARARTPHRNWQQHES